MPAGAIASDTFATGNGSEDYVQHVLSFPAGTLHDGVNTIAVEVHQVNLTSSDAGFDMALALFPGPGLLYNDSDPEGDAITAVTVTDPPDNGMIVSINPDGTFVYMPDGGFDGMDTFQYTITAGGLDSAPATVTIIVTPASCLFDADLDDDGDVDRRDLALLSQSYGASGAGLEGQGDINCDGAISLLDLVEWRNRQTPPPSPSASPTFTDTVEPAAVDQVLTSVTRTPVGGSGETSLPIQSDTGPQRVIRRVARDAIGSNDVTAIRQSASRVLRARRAHARAIDEMFGG
jgi:hypothetical protein